MRLFLLLLLLLPAVAVAQMKGVKLAHKDEMPTTRQDMAAGQMSVGKDAIAVFPDSSDNRPNLFKFDGSPIRSLMLTANAATFAGGQLCVANIQGLHVLDTADFKEVDLITGRVRGSTELIANADGSTLIALCRDKIAVVVVLRRENGKFKVVQTIAPDEAALAKLRAQYARVGRPGDLVVEEDATRVPGMMDASSIALSADGKHLFVTTMTSNSLVVFEKDAKQWRHVQTVLATNMGRIENGLMRPTCMAVGGDGEIFVGGIKRLSRLTFDGKTITSRKWWIDDTENEAFGKDVLPCLEHVLSLALSANGKYLFLASKDTTGIAVLDVGGDNEKLVGIVSEPSSGTTLDVAISPDGKRLYAKTNKCQLLVYDLDATFTE